MEIRHITHLHWRAGFGPDLTQLKRLEAMDREEVVAELFSSSEPYDPIDVASKPVASLFLKFKDLEKEEKKALKKFNLEELRDMNVTWMNYLTFGKEQLREKLAFLWHDHFACFVPYSYMMQLHINKLREFGMGSYRDLLHLIAKDAAMLEFLNNLQNKKKSPNENFAREVMELYTLGIGNYTEDDIKEAARAFTGWAYDSNGDFYLREKQHDTDSKTFRGETGYFEGEDILNKLLDDKACAEFITRKIWKYFISEQADEVKIGELATWYYENNYDTGGLLKQIFLSDWFYENACIGTLIKSPVMLITGLRRQFAIEFKQDNTLLFIQKILGQIIGYPPNVGGWNDGKPWIDSSTVVFRLRLADALFTNADLDMEDKDEAEALQYAKLFKKFDATLVLDHIYEMTDTFSPEEASALLLQYLVMPEHTLQERIQVTSTETQREYVYNYLREILRSPEYQLC